MRRATRVSIVNTTEVAEDYLSLHVVSFVFLFRLEVLGLGSLDAGPRSNLALTAALLLAFEKLPDAVKTFQNH